MIYNNLKIALRQLQKHKFYSIINIGGLSVSVACSIIILLYIQHEWSFDRYHENADQTHRLLLDINLNQSEAFGVALPPPVAPTMLEEFPEVLNAGRLNVYLGNAGSNNVRVDGAVESSYQEGFVYADQELTQIFDFVTIQGDPNSWLKDPNTVIITEKVAQQFFKNTDPIGQTLVLNDDDNARYRVSGVIEDMPDNTHLQYDYFLSMSTLEGSVANNWINNSFFAYVQLKENTDVVALENKLEDFSMKYFAPQFREVLNIDLEAGKAEGMRYNLVLQALSDIHLRSSGFSGADIGGDIRYIRLFGAIAIFLVLIAHGEFYQFIYRSFGQSCQGGGHEKSLGLS